MDLEFPFSFGGSVLICLGTWRSPCLDKLAKYADVRTDIEDLVFLVRTHTLFLAGCAFTGWRFHGLLSIRVLRVLYQTIEQQET